MTEKNITVDPAWIAQHKDKPVRANECLIADFQPLFVEQHLRTMVAEEILAMSQRGEFSNYFFRNDNHERPIFQRHDVLSWFRLRYGHESKPVRALHRAGFKSDWRNKLFSTHLSKNSIQDICK
jgi:hypothetical protein